MRVTQIVRSLSSAFIGYRYGQIWVSLFLVGVLWGQEGYVEEGMASYYGKEFEGLRTASGELYSRKALTAAHRTLPFGCRVKVTNLENNKSVILRINDRGPQHSHRILDVSEAAAKKLGFWEKGLVRVRIEVTELSFAPKRPMFFNLEGKAVNLQGYSLQIGAFREKENAYRQGYRVQQSVKQPVYVWEVAQGKEEIYRVLVGNAKEKRALRPLARALRRAGWESIVQELP
ncbi:MAG: septal ring lytic transglycosylase RlpA family protein [Bacteroidia bacterium]